MPPNGPELSCGGEAPQRRNPVRAWQVMSNSNWLFRACKIVDGPFRQLERLVRQQSTFDLCGCCIPDKLLLLPPVLILRARDFLGKKDIVLWPAVSEQQTWTYSELVWTWSSTYRVQEVMGLRIRLPARLVLPWVERRRYWMPKLLQNHVYTPRLSTASSIGPPCGLAWWSEASSSNWTRPQGSDMKWRYKSEGLVLWNGSAPKGKWGRAQGPQRICSGRLGKVRVPRREEANHQDRTDPFLIFRKWDS